MTKEEKCVLTLEECQNRMDSAFNDNDPFSFATSFECGYYRLKQYYPDNLDEVVQNAINKSEVVDLSDHKFKDALNDECSNYLEKFSSNKNKENAVVPRKFDEEENKVVIPLQVALDVMDPGMFTVADVKLVDDSNCVFICAKNKPGKAIVVDKINELKSKNVKCKIDSKQLTISVTKDGFDEVLEFIGTVLEAESQKAKGETTVEPTTANNSNYDLDAIAEQYGTTAEDLKEKLKTPDGQAWIADRMSKLAKQNASDPVVQELATGKKPEPLSPEEMVKISNELIEKNQNLKNIDEALKGYGFTSVFSRGVQGLTNAALYFGNEKRCEVAFDVRGVVLGPENKWTPVVPETAADALDAPWFMISVTETWTMLYNYIVGNTTVEQVCAYKGIGALYNPEYRHLNNHINLNDVFKSQLVTNKPNTEKDRVYNSIAVLVRESDILAECTELDNNTYFRLFKYTDPDNFELISDGKTRNWLNGNKPAPVQKGFKLTRKDGKWEAGGFKPKSAKAKNNESKKEEKKSSEEAPKAEVAEAKAEVAATA